ncbi:hypothetical protein I7I48_10373 [Histoplasma ohiense]|nr:hypothetical protein I7I48_10373 [Histoplasma ohiense (nom. inval.)]
MSPKRKLLQSRIRFNPGVWILMDIRHCRHIRERPIKVALHPFVAVNRFLQTEPALSNFDRPFRGSQCTMDGLGLACGDLLRPRSGTSTTNTEAL